MLGLTAARASRRPSARKVLCVPRSAVLFVCLGNICRSPLAEAAFRQEAERRGLDVEIDSAGTGAWHVGHPPDRRAQAVARRHGIDIGGYRARQVTPEDFRRFTHVVALDRDNLAALKALRPRDATAELLLLLDAVEGRRGEAVADPYFGDDAGFDVTWADAVAGAKGLADRIEGKG
jgi:protein-tyrosine phosphatase